MGLDANALQRLLASSSGIESLPESSPITIPAPTSETPGQPSAIYEVHGKSTYSAINSSDCL